MEARKETKSPEKVIDLDSILTLCKDAFAAKHTRSMSPVQEYVVKKTLKNIEKQLEKPNQRQVIIDYIATLLIMARPKDPETDVITLTDIFLRPIPMIEEQKSQLQEEKKHKSYFVFFTKLTLTPSVLLEEKKQKMPIEVFAADAGTKAINYLSDDGDCVMVANRHVETPRTLFKKRRLAPTKILFFVQIEGHIQRFDLAIWEHGWTAHMDKKILSYAPLHPENVPEFIKVLSELYCGQIRACNLILPKDSEKTKDPNYIDFIGVKDHFRWQKSQKPSFSI